MRFDAYGITKQVIMRFDAYGITKTRTAIIRNE